jgi:hypothetical protein
VTFCYSGWPCDACRGDQVRSHFLFFTSLQTILTESLDVTRTVIFSLTKLVFTTFFEGLENFATSPTTKQLLLLFLLLDKLLISSYVKYCLCFDIFDIMVWSGSVLISTWPESSPPLPKISGLSSKSEQQSSGEWSST